MKVTKTGDDGHKRHGHVLNRLIHELRCRHNVRRFPLRHTVVGCECVNPKAARGLGTNRQHSHASTQRQMECEPL